MDQARDPAPVVHDPLALRFRMELPGGTAELAYVPVSDTVLDLYSTWVPPGERGRRVVPSCWYVRRWMEAHPEQADLLA